MVVFFLRKTRQVNIFSDIYSMAFICDRNYIVQIRFCDKKKIALIWVRSRGSKFQAKNTNYKIEVQGSESKVSYEGPVRRIDEKSEDIVKSLKGLTIPIDNISQCSQRYRLNFSVEIKNLKLKENLPVFESEKYVLKEPLKKKIRSENT